MSIFSTLSIFFSGSERWTHDSCPLQYVYFTVGWNARGILSGKVLRVKNNYSTDSSDTVLFITTKTINIIICETTLRECAHDCNSETCLTALSLRPSLVGIQLRI